MRGSLRPGADRLQHAGQLMSQHLVEILEGDLIDTKQLTADLVYAIIVCHQEAIGTLPQLGQGQGRVVVLNYDLSGVVGPDHLVQHEGVRKFVPQTLCNIRPNARSRAPCKKKEIKLHNSGHRGTSNQKLELAVAGASDPSTRVQKLIARKLRAYDILIATQSFRCMCGLATTKAPQFAQYLLKYNVFS